MTTSSVGQRQARANQRSWWRDGIVAAPWIVSAAAVGFFIAGGGLLSNGTADYVYAVGQIAGLVAAVLVMGQLLLISRAPWVERILGHDRAAQRHTLYGKVAFVLMLVHAGILLVVSAHFDGNTIWEQPFAFAELGWYMTVAQLGLGIFALVVATSLVKIRSRWKYENWHAVHLLVYVAIAFVIPHQFLEGSTFRSGGAAWWFWLLLYVGAIGSFVYFRVVRPLVQLGRHDLRVTSVTPLESGAVSILMTGRDLDKLGGVGGQFFLWRFLDGARWREAHPYSLSRRPDGSTLRITVKASGDGSESLRDLRVGTRVLAEGPLGVFSGVSRTKPGVVFVAAGIGVTPVRAMLEHVTEADHPCSVVLRVRSEAEAPLLDEVRALAAERGAQVHVLVGSRGAGWLPADGPSTLADLIPDVGGRDVFICGPVAWAHQVEADALAAGCAPESVHRERFGW